MINLIDNQGMIETRSYKNEEEALKYLHDFHSIDWEGEANIYDMSLNFMLDYGDWHIEKT